MGLSQLHQLRGRVGRGSLQSYCVLLYQQPLSQTARKRLQVMRQTQDGFVIAEQDLQIRGAGDLLGTRQTGLLQLRIADLARDVAWIPVVKSLGERLLTEAPQSVDLLITRWLRQGQRYIKG
jgi:ATP-dependent DNA helicase RecG